MSFHITLSVETDLSEAAVKDTLLNMLIWHNPDAMKVQILDDHGPERRAITLEDLGKVRDALQIGREMAEDLLARHDLELGRTTRSNRLTAEAMEADIANIKEAIKKVQP